MQANPALHGLALLPMQDPEAAVLELRRAGQVLGMCGVMLPANGLSNTLGSKEFWPVCVEAERLGCALAVRGGSGVRLGFDHLAVRPAAHALAHPSGLLISLTSIVFNGVFDHYLALQKGFSRVEWLDSSYLGNDSIGHIRLTSRSTPEESSSSWKAARPLPTT